MRIAAHLTRPTRTAIRKRITCRPYLVLLPVGLAVPPLLPETRCALTAPFQPCRGFRPVGGFISVALSLRFPPGVFYPSPCFRGARPFLDTSCDVPRPSSHLTARNFSPRTLKNKFAP